MWIPPPSAGFAPAEARLAVLPSPPSPRREGGGAVRRPEIPRWKMPPPRLRLVQARRRSHGASGRSRSSESPRCRVALPVRPCCSGTCSSRTWGVTAGDDEAPPNRTVVLLAKVQRRKVGLEAQIRPPPPSGRLVLESKRAVSNAGEERRRSLPPVPPLASAPPSREAQALDAVRPRRVQTVNGREVLAGRVDLTVPAPFRREGIDLRGSRIDRASPYVRRGCRCAPAGSAPLTTAVDGGWIVA